MRSNEIFSEKKSSPLARSPFCAVGCAGGTWCFGREVGVDDSPSPAAGKKVFRVSCWKKRKKETKAASANKEAIKILFFILGFLSSIIAGLAAEVKAMRMYAHARSWMVLSCGHRRKLLSQEVGFVFSGGILTAPPPYTAPLAESASPPPAVPAHARATPRVGRRRTAPAPGARAVHSRGRWRRGGSRCWGAGR